MKNCPNCGFDLEAHPLSDVEEPQLKFPKPQKKEKKKKWSSIKPKGLTLDSALDEAFRLLVKCEADWQCVYPDCGRRFNVNPIIRPIGYEDELAEDFSILDCSHFFRRSDAGTKHEIDNAHAFCRTCHTRLEKLKNFERVNPLGFIEKQEYCDFTLKLLGEKRFEELRILSSSIVKIGDESKRTMLTSIINQIKELGYETSKLNFKFKKVLKDGS